MPDAFSTPGRSAFLTAEWRWLVMLNYSMDSALLAPFVPEGTTLDSWNGETLVSVVGFRFLRTRLLGVPLPMHRDFDEVNLRFYVRAVTDGETRRGVVFIREIVPRRASRSLRDSPTMNRTSHFQCEASHLHSIHSR